MDASGKTILVTGAASGIGRTTAIRFAERGAAKVACLDIHEGAARETARRVEAAGARAVVVPMDLAKVSEIRDAYARVVDAFGRIDAAAHIGGYSWRGATLEVTEAQWDAVINVNLRGSFFCCQSALRVMLAQGSGAIVNMSADAAFYPIPGFALQAAGKGGIVHMTRTLALEAARSGVRVNAVSPGIVRVENTGVTPERGAPVQPPGPASLAAASVDELPEQTAPGRWIRAEEIADTFVFLCSDAASGINGELIFVNGGGYFSLRF